MKTKRILLGILILALASHCRNGFGQDVSINITPLQPSILNFTFGELEVVLCNEDPDPITAPANKLRPLISFPDNLTIKEVVNADGTPLTNFTIQNLVNDPSNHSVRLLYNATLANAECIAFRIRFKGNAVGTGVITATLGFQGAQTTGNLTANDNSTATTPVDINLPVTLQEFDAMQEGSSALLTWVTTEETNSDYFDVQRSTDGKLWSTFKTVPALGESKSAYSYKAVDEAPLKGENLYRLHMIDKDGSSAYSRIRQLRFAGNSMSLYPNPVSSLLTVKSDNWDEVAQVIISDLKGVEVYNSGSHPSQVINVSGFKDDIYIVLVKQIAGDRRSYKIVVSK